MLLLKNRKSKSAVMLAKALGIKRTTTVRPGKMYINWGVSSVVGHRDIYNVPESVAIACNKLNTLDVLMSNNIPVPEYCTYLETAAECMVNGGWKRAVCRTLLSGHSGAGIVIADDVSELVQAPLYTKYIKKQAEYRVHCIEGEHTLIQKKIKLSPESLAERGITKVNKLIRNLDNGWVYTTNVDFPHNNIGESLAEILETIAARSLDVLGLDFGAVDIIHEKNTGSLYVLEVNTAPGLSDVTLEFYRSYFCREYLD